MEKLALDSFIKNQNWEYHVQVEVYGNILKLHCWPPAFTLCKIFWKTKRSLEIAYLPHLLHEEKYFPCYILSTNQISLPDCLYFLRYWVICVLQLFVAPVSEVINFEINHSFIKPFFYITKNSEQKMEVSHVQKELLTWNKKHFSSFLKCF